MASRRRQDNVRVTFGDCSSSRSPAPPSYDGNKNLNIIYGINKAWRSLGELKDKLSNADNAISRSAISSAVQQVKVARPNSNGPRQRKILRIGDRNRHAETKSSSSSSLSSPPPRATKMAAPTAIGKRGLVETSAAHVRSPPVRSAYSSESKMTHFVDDVELGSSKDDRDPLRLWSPPRSSRDLLHQRPTKLVDQQQQQQRIKSPSKSILSINMHWEPIVELQPERSNNNVNNALSGRLTSNESDVVGHKNIKWMDADEMPSKISSPSTRPSNPAQDFHETADVRSMKRQMTRKSVVCKPEKIEEAIINPYTWRKGQNLITKELDPFRHKRPLSAAPPTEDCASKPLQENDQGGKLLQDQPDTMDIGGGGSQLFMDNAGANKQAVRKRPKKPAQPVVLEPSPTATKQSTPKLRHYDRTSVRRYIQKQRKERRKKADLDKMALETNRLDRREKLKELRERQHELAKSSKKADLETDGSARPKWPLGISPDRFPPSLTWVDLASHRNVNSLKMTNNANNVNDDFAYKRLMSGGRSNKGLGWRPTYESSSSMDERMSSSSHASGSCPSSAGFQSKENVKNDVMVNQPEASASKQVSERLKILSEESKCAVDDLMARMIQSKTSNNKAGVETPFATPNNVAVIDGRAAKLESLKKQALSIQSAIEEETQRLKSRFQMARQDFDRTTSPLNVLDGVVDGGAKLKSIEVTGHHQSAIHRQEKCDSSLSEGPLTDESDLDKPISVMDVQPQSARTFSPVDERPQTDEILQLVLASSVFAKPVPSRQTNADEYFPLSPPARIESNGRRDSSSRKASLLSFQSSGERRSNGREKASTISVSMSSAASTDLPDFKSVNHTTLSNRTPTHSSLSTFSTFDVDNDRRSANLNHAIIYPQDRRFSSSRKSDMGGSGDTATPPSVAEEENDEWVLSEGPLSSDASDVEARSRIVESVQQSVDVGHSDNSISQAQVSGDQAINLEESIKDPTALQSPKVTPSTNKMSPNALRLRMSAELTYLDTVHESLGQITDMERVRAVSLAQQEAVALAQVVQARTVGQQGFSDTMSNNNLRLMQSQAEAAKLSAEAAKLMAETNGILVASRESTTGNPAMPAAQRSQETVAAAAAAAVTAALSQLQLNLRRHNDRAKTFLSTLTPSSEHGQSSSSAEEENSLDDYDSGNSQQSVRLKSAQSSNAQPGSRSQTVASEQEDQEKDKSKSRSAQSSSAVPEELLSEGPLSPATSSDIREDISPSREASEAGADGESMTEDEELSFRALLPSEGHLRSSRRRQHHDQVKKKDPRRMKTTSNAAESPSSDDQRSSMSSEQLVEPDKGDGGGGDHLDDVPLFSNEESFRRFTVSMVKQYMEEETVRNQHQQAVHELRNKALIDKANVELAWMELQKKQCQIKGQDDKIPPTFKKPDVDKTLATDVGRRQSPSDLDTNRLPAGEVAILRDDHLNATPIPISSHQVLQGLKKLQASKRYLTRREQKLHLRRKHVEELLNWQRLLDNEEVKVREMETMALTMLVPSNGHLSAVDTSSVVMAGTMMEVADKSILQAPKEAQVSSVNAIVTVIDVANFPSTDATSEMVPAESKSVAGGDVLNTEAFMTHASPLAPSRASLSSPIVLRSPLTPHRSKTRIRRESSGSEDSCTVSQSETTSELSDIEGRVHALKEDLRRRKVEAEHLRREQRRKNKERLRAQEASLLRQIDAYDKFIVQTRQDLQRELELQADHALLNNSSKTAARTLLSVRPVIKQPKVAESKRIQRQAGFDQVAQVDVNRSVVDQDAAPRESEASSVASTPQTSLESGSEEPNNFNDNSSSRTSVVCKEGLERESQPCSLNENEKEDGQKEFKSVNEGQKELMTPEGQKELMTPEGQEQEDESAQVSAHDGTLSFNSEIGEDIPTGVMEAAADDDDDDDDDDGKSSPTVHLLNLDLNRQENLHLEAEGDIDIDIGIDDKMMTMPNNVEDVGRHSRLVDDIVETILGQLIRTELLSGRTKSIAADSAEPQLPPIGVPTVDDVLIMEIPEVPRIAQKICDDLTLSLLKDAVDDCVRIRHELLSSAKSVQHESKSVSERISDIMNEVKIPERRLCSLDDDAHCDQPSLKSRPQDLLILSFPSACADVMSPPLPISSAELQDEPSTVTASSSTAPTLSRRSFSPVRGESSDPAQAAEVDEQQEWFEEDYGLSTTMVSCQMSKAGGSAEELETQGQQEEQELVQHYQIYPFQDYFYIREIPNKPPPPYTPPGESPGVKNQPLQSAGATVAFPSGVLPFNGTPISSADFKRLSADVLAAVNYGRAETTRLLDAALQCDRLGRIVDGYFTSDDNEADIANRSRRTYKKFILQLVRETVSTIREEDRRPPCKPWSKPEWPSKHRRKRPRRQENAGDDDDLKAEVQRRILPLLLSDAEDQPAMSTCVVDQTPSAERGGRKKRDVVDDILLRELRKEESEWVDYDEDETTVKMQLADSILNDLIGEIVLFLAQGT